MAEDTTQSHAPQETPGALEADRRVKLARLREEFGVDPYGRRTDGLVTLNEARSRFDPAADDRAKASADAPDERPTVKIAGRIVLHRDIGKLVFMTLRDHSGEMQVAANKRDLAEADMAIAKLADLGDIVVAEGPLGTTKTGEVTVWARSFAIATKSLAPPPGKFHGLHDPELRYRRRYVDMYSTEGVIGTFKTRSRIIKTIRDLLTERGFLEVETPMMQPIAGGAAARPFVTHHNALDIDLFLRIAPELYLKRLLVGGMHKVFEINRNFRNEGIDRSHNPEFTMLELYEAFGDLYSVMEITEQVFHTVATTVCGSDTLPYGDHPISYALPFARVRYHEVFERVNGFPASDAAKLADKARQLHLDPSGKDHDLLLNEVWEATVEHTLVQPTFVIDYPASMCPLTKRKPDEPHLAERFELFVANMELANAYTELNDPDVQLANFQQQVAGEDDEAATFRSMDHDFIDALKVGMPPAGGLGIGIDRLVMLMTNKDSIRDVILFPLMRPIAGRFEVDVYAIFNVVVNAQDLKLDQLMQEMNARFPPGQLDKATADQWSACVRDWMKQNAPHVAGAEVEMNRRFSGPHNTAADPRFRVMCEIKGKHVASSSIEPLRARALYFGANALLLIHRAAHPNDGLWEYTLTHTHGTQ